jgi:hypothetical protein
MECYSGGTPYFLLCINVLASGELYVPAQMRNRQKGVEEGEKEERLTCSFSMSLSLT